MKGFVKEILADAAILSGLIILPVFFLGPGWRPKSAFDQHGRPINGGYPAGGSSPREETKEKQPDRFIEILHAFPNDEPKSRRE